MPKLPFNAARMALVRMFAPEAARATAARTAVESAFRLPGGRVVRTGAFHDLTRLPAKWQTDEGLAQVEQGFVAPDGRFFTRREAEHTLSATGEAAPYGPYSATVAGSRQAPPVLSSGHSDLWLRARAEALRRHSAQRAEPPRSFRRLAREAQESGGFTYDLATGARPARGFAFSASPQNEQRVAELTPEAIAEYAQTHERALLEPDAYLGAWRSPEGEWYLDVSTVLQDREAALKAARAAKQRAVYDLGLGQSLEVEP